MESNASKVSEQPLNSGQTTNSASPSEIGSLQWLLNISEKVAIAFLIVLLFAGALPGIPPETVVNVALVTITYIILNGLFILFLKYSHPGIVARLLQRLAIPFDVVICTIALYAAGGVLTPIFITYPLVVMISIIVLDPRGVYWTAGFSLAMYCLLTLLEAYHVLPEVRVSWGSLAPHSSANSTTYALYLFAVCSILLVCAFMGNRIALLIRQRNEQIQSQLKDLRSLYDISSGLGNLINEEQVLRYIVGSLKALQNATTCIIGLVNKDGSLRLAASAGTSEEALSRYKNMRADTPMLSELFRRARPLIIENIAQHPEFQSLAVDPDTHSVCVFPIKDKARVIGVIWLLFNVRKSLNAEYFKLLSTIASQTGVSLQRAQLVSDAQRIAKEMSSLYNMGLHTGSTLSMSEVIRRASANIEKLLKPDTHYIALYDAMSDNLDLEIFKAHGRTLPRMSIRLAPGGLTSRIIELRTPLLAQGSSWDKARVGLEVETTDSDMLSYLGAPMISEDRVIGIISVQSAQPMAFDGHDQRLLMAVAAQTTMALENARLHQLAQEQAKMDSLTQVYNHGCFMASVYDAVANAEKDGSSLSLIMLDIDYFKQYNDKYGHVAGDAVLKLIAEALQASVRAGDVVGRWGGEEFGVLLPGADISTATEIARRIRRAVADLTPFDGYGRAIDNPTISQGVSSYPYPSTSAIALVEEADSALYTAKESGRNQLIIYKGLGVQPESIITSRLA